MSDLHLYNTLTKGEQKFIPITAGKVSMYTCGPTVYGRPHIGNYSSFLMADLLRRWLQFGLGFQVTHVKNITDVGHLVADADTGEDKVEKQAREEHGEVTHASVIAIARKYEAMYLEDERALNMMEPEQRPRATEYIEQMQKMIDVLLENGHAYTTEDGIYFDVHSSTPTPYGTLSGNTLDALESGSRVAVDEKKKHPADFALWKFCVGMNAKHALRWPSPGTSNPDGFPGWHIECSAMSSSLLGEQIDLHTGGEDNIFPHHECEVAQSESVTGKKPFVRLWLHKRRIQMGDQKMSKSLGNVKTLPDIVAAGYSPMDLRYYFLSVHYRTQLKFEEKGLDDAKKARRKIVEWITEVEQAPAVSDAEAMQYQTAFVTAMNADLNTPAALAAIFDCIAWSRNAKALGACKDFAQLIAHVFGCFVSEAAQAIPADVQALVEQRAAARVAKDFAKSDELRDAIAALGYEVRDGANGQEIKKL
jgi:cysteinyl-tRNA synthetase